MTRDSAGPVTLFDICLQLPIRVCSYSYSNSSKLVGPKSEILSQEQALFALTRREEPDGYDG